MTPGVWGGTQGSDGSGRRSTHFLPLGARLEGPPGSTPTRFRGGGTWRGPQGDVVILKGGVKATLEKAPRIGSREQKWLFLPVATGRG